MKEIFELFISQDDETPAHAGRETILLPTQEILKFIEPNLWPPNSLDLNLLDYGIWDVLQEKAYQININSVDALKKSDTAGLGWARTWHRKRGSENMADQNKSVWCSQRQIF